MAGEVRATPVSGPYKVEEGLLAPNSPARDFVTDLRMRSRFNSSSVPVGVTPTDYSLETSAPRNAQRLLPG